MKSRLQQLRERERMSVRVMSYRLGMTAGEYDALESIDHELTVAELVKCCKELGIPFTEYFEDFEPVPKLANVLRAFKSAVTLRDPELTQAQRIIIIDRMCDDLSKVIPTMATGSSDGTGLHPVRGWPLVGHKRSSDELSQREEAPINTSMFATDWSLEPAI